MEQSFVAPRRPILLYHRFPATLLKPGLTGKPMVKGKHRYYAKWRTAALTVGFLTLVYVASAHAQGSEYIYWVEFGTSKIRRANLDGTNPVDHITGVNDGQGIALDLTNNHIYWVEVGISKIRRANLDGTNPVDHITGVSNGQGIALQIASSSSSSASSGSSQVIRYVPFKSQYVVLALFALLGCWYVLRPH